MHQDIETLLIRAEADYLTESHLDGLTRKAALLANRLEIYEILRDQETKIFQTIVDQLQAQYSQGERAALERALKHWLLIFRHCAMAMLLNDLDYLHRSILDWIQGLAKIHQTQEIDAALYPLLKQGLKECLTAQQLALLQTFLQEVEKTLPMSAALAV